MLVYDARGNRSGPVNGSSEIEVWELNSISERISRRASLCLSNSSDSYMRRIAFVFINISITFSIQKYNRSIFLKTHIITVAQNFPRIVHNYTSETILSFERKVTKSIEERDKVSTKFHIESEKSVKV